MSKRLLIVDDHPIIRDALVTSLASLDLFDELETAKSFQELKDKLELSADYQLLILDLSLTDISGAGGMLYIRENFADIPIIIFSGNDSTDIIAECFERGVHGFISKSSSMPVIVNAIKMVLAGSTYIPPSAVRLMGFEPNEPDEVVPPENNSSVEFSPKQQAVFEQLMLGVPNKVIARRLGMAQGTVKTHLHSIYQQLRVHSRAQAILKSRQLGLID